MLADLQDANEADGPMFKIKDDPRIIPGIGNFIRKRSIDELPQLLNVFKGDMSLVGPRPPLPKEVQADDDPRTQERLQVKPRCTGPWQVGDRSNATCDTMLQQDVGYVRNRSILQDLVFILGTLRVMVVGGGAFWAACPWGYALAPFVNLAPAIWRFGY